MHFTFLILTLTQVSASFGEDEFAVPPLPSVKVRSEKASAVRKKGKDRRPSTPTSGDDSRSHSSKRPARPKPTPKSSATVPTDSDYSGPPPLKKRKNTTVAAVPDDDDDSEVVELIMKDTMKETPDEGYYVVVSHHHHQSTHTNKL
jgi:hypothetical protein